MGNTQRKDYDTTVNPETKNPDWMTSIPDKKSLCDLSIPGTNMSVYFPGVHKFQHQSWDLKSQFEAGIRFIDLGLRVSIMQDPNFFHGILRDAIRFLTKHSKETILMRVHEFSPLARPREFSELATKCIEDAGIAWFWTSTTIPTLGQVRGKIVIMQDYDGPVIGIPCKSLVIAEDKNALTMFGISEKLRRLSDSLEAARKSNGDKLYLTHTAGHSLLAYPYSVANEVNAYLYNYLDERKNQKNRWGIIAMDYPGSFLVEMVIQSN